MKTFKIPSSLFIVMFFLFLVTCLTWFIPSSVIAEDENGNQVIYYNSSFDEEGNIIRGTGTKPKGLWNLFTSPVEGFISSADVSATILISGGALAILSYCGALDAGIHFLLKKFKGKSLIFLLMLVFALMGTIYGSWEELTAYAVAMVPLFTTAGYDTFTALAVIVVGSTIGNMASVVNPYSVGAAVSSIGNDSLTLGSGIILRILLFVILFVIGAFLVISYAESIKKPPSSPSSSDGKGEDNFVEMTGRRKWSLFVFFLMILFCIAGYIPWDSVNIGNINGSDFINAFIPKFENTFPGKLLGLKAFMPFGLWYFNEFSVTWLIGSVVIAFINRMDEALFVREFLKGASDLIGVVFVLSAARGIAITMGDKTEGMSITFIYKIKSLLEGVPVWAFPAAAILIYVLIGLFLQSTSGVAGITMPIFSSAASAIFSSSLKGEVLLISSFTLGISFMSALYPGATVMGISEIAKIPYDQYLKKMYKFLLPLILAGALLMTFAPYLGLL